MGRVTAVYFPNLPSREQCRVAPKRECWRCAGIVGLIQTVEAIKLILRKGDSLVGRLLSFDALQMKFREFKVGRDSSCPVCGDNPTIFEPIDYQGFCNAATTNGIPSISVIELQRKLQTGGELVVLDVREPFEFEIASIEGSRLIPLGQLGERVDELQRDRETVVLCKSGVRSAHAVELLQRSGFGKAFNLDGGIDAWADQVDPTMQKY